MNEIRKQALLEAQKTRDKASETRLEFLEAELDSAFTFAQVAATSYSMGHDDHGATAAAKARNALDQAGKLLNDVPSKSSRTERCRFKLTQLAEMIAKLPKTAT